jgi:hypothetical protein
MAYLPIEDHGVIGNISSAFNLDRALCLHDARG